MPTQKPTHSDSIKVAIIGAGPAGLMAAQILAESGVAPVVFDAMPSAARKFLQAGRGGLNLTHGEPFTDFKMRYFEAHSQISPALALFSPSDLRQWAADFGFETFVGSSGKVYPLDKKAAPLLRTWLQHLKQLNTQFKMKHQWVGWYAGKGNQNSPLTWLFETPDGPKTYQFDQVILALGGASWPHLGSTGTWKAPLEALGVKVTPFQAANMGFDVDWSPVFIEKFAGTPLKNIGFSLTTVQGKSIQQLGELMLTEKGVEGSLIYTHSKAIRERLATASDPSEVSLYLDLFPHRTTAQLTQQLSAKQGKQSLSSFWKRQGLSGVKASLLREVLNKTQVKQPGLVVSTLKHLPLKLKSARPLTEAISTAGGVAFTDLNQDLMLKSFPNLFCAGEMTDWEAPTGGYLLTAVMAQGKQAALGLLKQRQNNNP